MGGMQAASLLTKSNCDILIHVNSNVSPNTPSYANILLNLLFRKYGKFPDDYKIAGFDNSSISSEAVIPINTVSQQIDVITVLSFYKWKVVTLYTKQLDFY